ncbi:MAG: UDP-glucose/GDP-mannose dehydrogenase family protein [Candidatus Marinimicrobia bacterium]|jgi:UDPglucose 6-dehydrogenase|nr:UDP-glucose/GDP-mannose dehydrogenase family protein [Candidatus Neomarinimicrobiota bacterium]MDP6260758.1 UDP-glucose/GDP-mannose dehydrogenase family protein [Candidatus Neomarinimicrobiota bacterium]MDP7126695.1 UDP-glucose/GDP-mannose dehydrogenase family protein [Candidatus Neomarinimicrobiota bacterium]MDP7336358.1 UDP-glucose/GDP-mannose dehydrogenase family protein [Candidatus Neomarinimicrobiota bacterium]MDP7475266.1 UDP-glucose/GDP-mannose dehydrogenase family protein [Candidatus|tara:strand:- start:221 stop:1537 length:1317 start_codon:yes stop_codon:yes gene_type:complete
MRHIAIIGTGYVGLVSGSGISDFGHKVICADISEEKIKVLQAGKIPIYEPGLDELIDRNTKAERLSFSTDVGKTIRDSEVIFIAVGTPQSENGEADISAVKAVAKTIGQNLNSRKVVCTKSTVPIGTGKLVMSIINENNPEKMEFDYVSNPEFLREGSAVKDFLWPDRLVIGTESDWGFEVMRDVYRPLYINETPIIHTTVETSELIKYASNAFLSLKISYINEISALCEKVGADVHVVAKTMGSDGRISPKFLHPGPGFGGSCFPKDISALVSMAQNKNVPMRTIQAAIETNAHQKKRMVKKLQVLTGDFSGLTIGILGLAFKSKTDDVRESASLEMVGSLLKAGAQVKAYDPEANTSFAEFYPQITYCKTWEEAVKDTDAVAVMTEWNEFRTMDAKTLKNLMKSPIILDTRNILSRKELQKNGFSFDNVGRPMETK